MALLSKAAEQQFGAGIWPDSGNDTAPMIIDSNNVCYQNGRIGPIPQSVPFYNGDKQVDVIWTQNIDGIDNIFFVVSQEIRQIAGNVLTSLSFLTNRRKPQFATFGNFTLVADGGKLLVRRGASANFERIETAPLADFVIVIAPLQLFSMIELLLGVILMMLILGNQQRKTLQEAFQSEIWIVILLRF